jgi:hypothetical protein
MLSYPAVKAAEKEDYPMKVLPWLFLISLFFIATAEAQVKKQFFAGTGGSFPFVGDPSPTATVGGAAVIPFASRIIVRPAIALSRNFPDSGKPTSQIQALVMVGYRLRPYVALMAGRGEAFLFPPGKPNAVLPVTIVSTAWSPWSKRLGRVRGIGLFTPISFTATKGWGAALQGGYTW